MLSKYGTSLAQAGYNIIPIQPGYKYPKDIPNWQRTKSKQSHIKSWIDYGRGNYGIGILAETTHAVDLDITNENVLESLRDYCIERVGKTYQRTGKPPKTLLPYRAPLNPLSKQSTAFKDAEGSVHRVEILGKGQQWVAFGIHPEINKPYSWAFDQSILELPREQLPILDASAATDILKKFGELAEEQGWLPYAEHRAITKREFENDAAAILAGIEAPLEDIDRTRLATDLAVIPANDYHRWIEVGMALHHQFRGGKQGFNLWNAWSKTSDKYQAEVMAEKWRSFKTRTKGEPITAATILGLAKQIRAGEEPQRKQDSSEAVADKGEELQDFIRRYVYIRDGDRVADLDKPAWFCISKLNEFRNATAACVQYEQVGVRKPRSIAVPLSKIWLGHKSRKTAISTTYRPGEKRIVSEHDNDWVNEFYMPEFPKEFNEFETYRFLDHLEYLIPAEEEREWFIDWIAFNLQYPHRRCKITPLHISLPHGTGRGWVVELLQRLLGSHNCSKIKMNNIVGEQFGGGYNDYLYKTLFCAIEEIRESDKRYKVSDSMRDILTEDTLAINCKYGWKGTARVYTNFFLMSNHPDALVLTQEDRRIYVISGPDEVKPNSYYTNLYGHLETEAWQHIGAYLLQRDLSKFNLQYAPMNDAKRKMIENNRTETEELFWALMQNPPHEVMTFKQIVHAMERLEGGHPLETPTIDQGQLIKLLQHHALRAVHGKQIRVCGRKTRPWILNGKDLSSEAVKQIVEQFNKDNSVL